jgi:glutamyl-tRNA synthetase
MKVLVPHLLFVNEKYNEDSLKQADGFAEKAVSKLKTDEIIQFERFGFVRIENINNKITGFFAHK